MGSVKNSRLLHGRVPLFRVCLLLDTPTTILKQAKDYTYEVQDHVKVQRDRIPVVNFGTSAPSGDLPTQAFHGVTRQERTIYGSKDPGYGEGGDRQ